MAEYIEREALETALDHRWSFLAAENSEYDFYTRGYEEAVNTVENFPSAADVAPVSELLALRDALYENDQITMRGLAHLNKLIAKYGGYDNG